VSAIGPGEGLAATGRRTVPRLARTTGMGIAGVLALLLAAAPAPASAPPVSNGLPEGRLVEGVACASDPTQSYALFLPDGYDAARRWPVLLVLDPRGRSVPAAELFLEPARELGWIVVSSNDTRSDVGMDPNRRAINALWPEIHERYAIDEKRIYLAGFSGTVGVAVLVSRETGAIAGIIAAGGRFIEEVYAGNRAPVFAAAGDADFNYQGMRAVHARLLGDGVPSRFESFPGGHEWMPPQVASHALQWMELQAMRRGLRARDDGLVDRMLSAELAAAAALESEGRTLEAMRRYQSVVLDFEGLRDVGAAKAHWTALEAEPEVARAAALEARWSEREQREREQINATLGRFLATAPAPPPERLTAELEVARLERQAEGDGIEAATARRVLAHLFSNLAFYLPQELLAAHRPGHAASALAVACRIEPDNPALWYNLACTLSLAGRRSPALDALEHAVEAGFADAALMRSDADLEAVRNSDRFRALMAAIEQRSAVAR
jgi:predicted esterase